MRGPLARLGVLALLPIGAAAACTRSDFSIGVDCEDGFCDPPPGFTPLDGGAEGSLPDTAQLLACIGTECPPPYATCGDKPSTVCGTNLMNDSENCGACGVSCGGADLARLRMKARCSDGACEFECTFDYLIGELFRDCNGIIDDGCEAQILGDPHNCGACGNECPAGVRCIEGMCGCPSGKIDCDGKCVNPRTDDEHCKTCGNACAPPAVACAPMPPNTAYGCVDAECGRLECAPLYGDCNGDVKKDGCTSDGCETSLVDPNHCGGCGVRCGPNQACRQNRQGRPVCMDVCTNLGLLQCGDGCVDPLTDPNNCGGCAISCVEQWKNEVPTCKSGMCESECAPGFADCNGDAADGCEIDLRSHPANCGACGLECDQRAGQPCINGVCLMVECDAGVEAK